jgi:hypothetical protein
MSPETPEALVPVRAWEEITILRSDIAVQLGPRLPSPRLKSSEAAFPWLAAVFPAESFRKKIYSETRIALNAISKPRDQRTLDLGLLAMALIILPPILGALTHHSFKSALTCNRTIPSRPMYHPPSAEQLAIYAG